MMIHRRRCRIQPNVPFRIMCRHRHYHLLVLLIVLPTVLHLLLFNDDHKNYYCGNSNSNNGNCRWGGGVVYGFHVPSSSSSSMNRIENRLFFTTFTQLQRRRPITTTSSSSTVVHSVMMVNIDPRTTTTQLILSATSSSSSPSSSSSLDQQQQQYQEVRNISNDGHVVIVGGGTQQQDNESELDDHENDNNIVPTTTSSSSSSIRRRFMYMTNEQDQSLKEKGDIEASIMNKPTPLEVPSIKKILRTITGSSSVGGGFGGFGSTSRRGASTISGTIKSVGKKNSRPPKKGGKSGSIGTTTSTTTISTSTTNKNNNNNNNIDPSTVQALVKVLETDGLVRIDNVMDVTIADTLRDYLIDLRSRATQAVEDGTIQDSQQRFADVLLNRNRCDLKVPLGPPQVNKAVLDVLHGDGNNIADDGGHHRPSMVRSVIEGVFDYYGGRGQYASLWELNCFMSTAGARRQLVHADNVCLEPVRGLHDDTDGNNNNNVGKEPILLTCFIALQDIDSTMGPTIWMPGTHTIDAHNRFFETGRDESSTRTDTFSPKNTLLATSRAVMGAPIPKGSCIIFDPRVLHCAGENCCYSDPQKTRALFYMSFKNPKVDNPGCPSTSGYGISTAELTMEELVSDLILDQKGLPTQRLGLLASSP